MSERDTSERIAADLLIAKMQINGTVNGFCTADQIASDFQVIYEQVRNAGSIAAKKQKDH